MKQKLHALIWFGAALLALAGCQQENVEVLGQGDSEVKAQFVFNVSTNTAATKQAAEATQADGATGKFLGISNAKLLTYALTNDNQILTEDAEATKVYDLASVMKAKTSGFSPRRIMEMSLQLGTNTVLFYGKAPDAAEGSYAVGPATSSITVNEKDYYGALDPNHGFECSKVVGSANFQLCKRLEDSEGFYAMEKVLAGILTVIMNDGLTVSAGTHLAISKTASPIQGGYPYGFDFIASTTDPSAEGYYPEITWSSYGGNTSPVEPSHGTFYPLEEKLHNIYKQMTTIYTTEGELRAGSGPAVLSMIESLWSVINSVRCAEPISGAEAVAKFFAVRVHTHLLEYFDATTLPTTGLPVSGVSFKTMKDISDKLVADKFWPENIGTNKPSGTWDSENSTYTGELGKAYTYEPAEFPFAFNILRGASYLTYDATKHYFSYPKYFNTSGMTGDPTPYDPSSTEGFTAEDYYYPAQLLYFGNSPVRTSDKEHAESDYPETTAAWVNETNWGEAEGKNRSWTGTRVTSQTRSVAMKNLIHYGVAMLETKVGYTDAAKTAGYITDNNAFIQQRDNGATEQDKHIAITDGTFTLTGVIIGGQYNKVDWDFLPKSDASEGFVYDKAVNSDVKLNINDFTKNYTVLFDNYKRTSSQEAVYVALEFQNNSGQDFYGNHNLIPKNRYFYLIGALPIEGKTLSSWPIEVPPYDYSGEGGTYKGVPRIFIQGYKTTVTFKLSTNSLKAAYLTVPDLRSSSLTLGLSVDIDWKQGLDYPEVVIGPADPTPSSGD